MITYKKLSENAGKFLAMTGYTVEEFQALPPFFQAESEKWVGESRPDGKPRNDRKYTDCKNSPLPAAEEKLIFILIYLRQAPTQEVHAALFDMRQPVANKRIHRLHPVLNSTPDTLGELPDRTAGDFIVTLRDENENMNININISADADRNEDEDADRNRERNADVNMNVTLSLCESENGNENENENENENSFFSTTEPKDPLTVRKILTDRKRTAAAEKSGIRQKTILSPERTAKLFFSPKPARAKKVTGKSRTKQDTSCPKAAYCIRTRVFRASDRRVS